MISQQWNYRLVVIIVFIQTFLIMYVVLVYYVKSKYKACKLDTMNTSFQEAVWCIVPLKEANSLLVGVIYRSPRSSESNDTSLFDLLKQVQGLGATHTLITGDFNFRHVDWSHWFSPEWDTVGNTFLETLDDLLLFQHVFTPTRQRQGQVPSTLDLVLSDDEHSVNKLVVTDSLGKSDHLMVEFEYICYAVAVDNHIPRYLYDLGDYQQIIAHLLEIDWCQIFL